MPRYRREKSFNRTISFMQKEIYTSVNMQLIIFSIGDAKYFYAQIECKVKRRYRRKYRKYVLLEAKLRVVLIVYGCKLKYDYRVSEMCLQAGVYFLHASFPCNARGHCFSRKVGRAKTLFSCIISASLHLVCNARCRLTCFQIAPAK